ncbi:chromosomal replication initiator protein DnaA [Flexistipes sinusarabici]|uniref:Chromosomal replication initiator protein DnaA n=1 Tax=Flexistipes sinusarabici TaxID=2352 RepID=A0A3D5QBX2_FLESI|nr:chromosomal replication initiator protein DnaA [Flexistipes sinusarabici]HCW92662.1 chromosomal replication initiator protein DnaA [Flexistipes sinusarabici]
MDNVKIWDEVLKEASYKLNEQEINTWLKPLSIAELRGDIVTISVPNRFYKTWVEDKYLTLIKNIFNNTLSIEADIELVIKNQTKKKNNNIQASSPTYHININNHNSNINKQYTFDTFVVGGSNQFSHAACMAVGEGFFHTYNPLFIYGGVGLGKTHLMHAVGNKLMQSYPKLKILYISSENFTNEMIYSLKTKSMDDFRGKYRSIDVLLFDDVQFLAGKERSTEEFFYTFNSLYDSQKQIIITCDKTPNEIPTMEDRLKSRFAWGLIADIQAPSNEEKTAILMKRAELMNLELSEEVALFIAENLKSDNIRELIGALIRLSAFASFHNEELSIELAKRSLDKFLIKKDRALNPEVIIDTVTSFFNIKPSELKSKKRTKSISYPRQICMYILREKLNISLQEVGEYFGGRDHATVLHSIKNIENKIKTDNELKELVNVIYKKLYS